MREGQLGETERKSRKEAEELAALGSFLFAECSRTLIVSLWPCLEMDRLSWLDSMKQSDLEREGKAPATG